MLLAQIVKVLFFWIKANWYPSTQFSLASVKPMLGYGLNVMGSSIIFFCLQQFNNFIVGKVYSKADLGLFSRGTRFPEIIISIIQGAILNISLPLFAKLQHDNAGLQNAMMRALRTVAFVTFPIMGLMLVKAEDITIILLTEKWRGSIIFLQLFCVVYCFEPVIAIHRELILAKGNSRLLLLIFIAVSVFEVALVLSLCRLGIMYVVIAAAISKLTQYVVYTFVNAREMGIEAIKQINWLLPFVLFTACTSAFVWGLHKLLLQHIFTNKWVIAGLAIELMIGGAVYLAITYFFKIKESELITQAFNMVLEKLPGRATHKN
jgi:O-antigen/teichoic acid export membrane protein